MSARRGRRAFTITEFMVASAITLALGFLILQAFVAFDDKKNELKFETNSSMALTRLFQLTAQMCQEGSGDAITWDAPRGMLLLQRVTQVDTHGTQEWAPSLFMVKYDPLTRVLSWGEFPLQKLGLAHTPKLPVTLDDNALASLSTTVVDQREALAEVQNFEVTQPSSSSLQMTVTMKDTTRSETQEFTRQRRFYLSSSGANVRQP